MKPTSCLCLHQQNETAQPVLLSLTINLYGTSARLMLHSSFTDATPPTHHPPSLSPAGMSSNKHNWFCLELFKMSPGLESAQCPTRYKAGRVGMFLSRKKEGRAAGIRREKKDGTDGKSSRERTYAASSQQQRWQSIHCPEGCAVPTGTRINYLHLDPVVGVCPAGPLSPGFLVLGGPS